jgi:O6-methylguanine-DNA--protein-cysteine methyltransferase
MHDSPLGTLGLAATDHGLASLMMRVDEAAYVHSLQSHYNVELLGQERPLEAAGLAPDGIVGLHAAAERPAGLNATRILTRTRLFLDRYFAGKQIAFEGPFDLLQGTLFQRSVWATLLTIPYGEVRSYRWLAGTVGHPGAFRAVGTANGQNPSGPAGSSNLPITGPNAGKVDEKALKKIAENWGTLPPSERQRIAQEMTRDVPAKYKPMIEEYFKSLNRLNGSDK